MSKCISLKQQIKQRWIYHFCHDNLPAADQDDVAVRNRPQPSIARMRAARPTVNLNSDSDGENADNSDSDDDVDERDADGGEDEVDEDEEENADDSADHRRRIRICIGYQFSKNISPPYPRRSLHVSAPERNVLRAKQMLRVKKQNHRLATLLSAATRQTCLLNYSDMCNFLLASTEGSSRVFVHRAYPCRQEIKIDTVVWEPRQNACDILEFAQHPDPVHQISLTERNIRIVTTHRSHDVGYQWMARHFHTREDPKTVWSRQNGLCMYCDVVTAPPDGEGVATSCSEYMESTINLSDRAKLLKLKQDANTELGTMLCDHILDRNKDIFVCVACAQAYAHGCQGRRVGFSHSPLLEVPVHMMDDTQIFHYFAACSGLHLVFSIFLSEVDNYANVDGGESELEHGDITLAVITIMAYVTNIRESKLVYVKLPVARLEVAGRRRFQNGFILPNPTFQAAHLQRLHESTVQVSLNSITSRWHVFYGIYGEHHRRLVNFMQEVDAGSRYAGRFFVYMCRCLFRSNIDSRQVDSADEVWQFLCDQTQYMYSTITEVSQDDRIFENNIGHQARFKERCILVARRDMRHWNINIRQEAPTISSVHVEHILPTPILDSIILLQPTCPNSLMTLRQNDNQHALYRLAAVYDMGSRTVHWLDTENWNHISTMPMCDATATQWWSSVIIQDPAMRGQMGFDDTVVLSCSDITATLLASMEDSRSQEPSADEKGRFVCFYQRLTLDRDRAHAMPLTMSSPIARCQARLLRKMFGGYLGSPSVAVCTAAAAAVARQDTQAYHVATQRCIRTMAVGVRLLGHIMLNELHAVFEVHNIPAREFHLFQYMFWNKFVIDEGFDRLTGRVHARRVLGHEARGIGDMDLDALFGRFRLFLARQCDSLYASRPPEIQAVFLDVSTLLCDFGLLVSANNTCKSTKHVIRNVSTFEARIAPHRDRDTYILGNTKLMLHYFSRVLEFTALQRYYSTIRDNLV